MVSDTVNTDRFLFLKKMLCILEMTRLQRIVKINDAEVNREELHADIKNELLALRDTFTIPVITIRKGVSAINLEEFHYSIKQLMDSRHKPNVSYWAYRKHSRSVQERDIYNSPDREVAFAGMAKEFEAKHGLWGDVRHPIAGLINNAQDMMNAINAFVEYRETDMNLPTAILFLNTLELIDWIFSLSEDGEGVFNGVTIPDDLEVDEDD